MPRAFPPSRSQNCLTPVLVGCVPQSSAAPRRRTGRSSSTPSPPPPVPSPLPSVVASPASFSETPPRRSLRCNRRVRFLPAAATPRACRRCRENSPSSPARPLRYHPPQARARSPTRYFLRRMRPATRSTDRPARRRRRVNSTHLESASHLSKLWRALYRADRRLGTRRRRRL